MTLFISAMYRMYRGDPRTEPCRTQNLTGVQSELYVLAVLNLVSVRAESRDFQAARPMQEKPH